MAGFAWAQHTGIAGVDVRIDGGEWVPARLADAINADNGGSVARTDNDQSRKIDARADNGSTLVINFNGTAAGRDQALGE